MRGYLFPPLFESIKEEGIKCTSKEEETRTAITTNTSRPLTCFPYDFSCPLLCVSKGKTLLCHFSFPFTSKHLKRAFF